MYTCLRVNTMCSSKNSGEQLIWQETANDGKSCVNLINAQWLMDGKRSSEKHVIFLPRIFGLLSMNVRETVVMGTS